MAKRYCEMCDRMVQGKECPLCGADTRALEKARPWPAKPDVVFDAQAILSDLRMATTRDELWDIERAENALHRIAAAIEWLDLRRRQLETTNSELAEAHQETLDTLHDLRINACNCPNQQNLCPVHDA